MKNAVRSGGRQVLENLARALVIVAFSSFMFGTIFWAAVDIFALYTENQFTGRMRAFDVEYWDAIRGAAFVIASAGLATAISNRVAKLVVGTEDGESE